MSIRNPIHTFILGVLACALFFVFFQPYDSILEHPALDSAALHKNIESYYKGQEEIWKAEKDSLKRITDAREPQVTYLTKQYYTTVPNRFAVSDSDAAALYIHNFIQEEAR